MAGTASSLSSSSTDTLDLQQLLQHMINIVKEQNVEFWNSAMGFIDAVEWREERWLHGLFALQFCVLVLAIATRRNFTVQSILFAVICAMVFMAQAINGYLQTYWESFSTQNYFDSSGLFISVVYSGPLMLILLLVLANMLIMVSSMLIKVKRTQLARDQQRQQRTHGQQQPSKDDGKLRKRNVRGKEDGRL